MHAQASPPPLLENPGDAAAKFASGLPSAPVHHSKRTTHDTISDFTPWPSTSAIANALDLERPSSQRAKFVNESAARQQASTSAINSIFAASVGGERVWKLWQVHARILSPAKASEQQPPGNVVEELAHTCICLGARLEDESADRLRVVLRRLVRHGTLVGHVSLVAGNRKHERLLDVALKLPDPLLELVERVLISDGKDQDGRDGTAIVQRSHRSEALLAGGVPNLQRHLLPIDGQLLD
eukprot:CAMPEP_0119355618 /NCGR_PEP_ID=MMETSP1334-20130426/4424_1 /TAXON_ID=127549 /ORGANISM="Calcidiscus leptoporus, Strain RCC1130" /LENGTH=239 /DNA_ID=CAMNT_0007369479 /DNA_START=239 /DNA_END=959 /DNA_ORIENTATION=+